jgi:hypothetical protein
VSTGQLLDCTNYFTFSVKNTITEILTETELNILPFQAGYRFKGPMTTLVVTESNRQWPNDD